MDDLKETVVFIVHSIKQLCFGFDQLDSIADSTADGSAAKAFYLNAIYNYIAAFYMLDKQGKPMGGAFYEPLSRHGLEHLLKSVQEILSVPLGDTTFGEVIRVFRNKVVVHPSYQDRDLDRIYKDVNMNDPKNQARFQGLLVRIYTETALLSTRLAKEADIPLEDLGIMKERGTKAPPNDK